MPGPSTSELLRNLGEQSPLKLDRGMNRLYTEGGLVYPLPLQ